MHPTLKITGATHLFTAPKNMKGHNIHIYTEQDNDIENIYNIKQLIIKRNLFNIKFINIYNTYIKPNRYEIYEINIDWNTFNINIMRK